MIPRLANCRWKQIYLCFFLLVLGCSTLSQRSLPPLDTSAPGWKTRQGQALWKAPKDQPEIAGDVVISVHPELGSFIQFSKTLPILTARIAPEGWDFHTIPENKRYSAGGKPPRRIVWLQLLQALDGREISDRWKVAHPSEQYIVLEDARSGERIEVRFQ